MTTLVRLLLAVLAVAVAAPAGAQVPRRLVTVNLCLDQIALRLAAPGQLVGLSHLSHDPRLSVLADRARAISPVRPTVESILVLRPDLVIIGRDGHANLKRLLRQAGVAVLEVPWASSLAEAEGLYATIGRALGREDEARSIVAGMQEGRRRLARPGPPMALAAVLQANRGTAGRGSLMDELLHLSGFRNLAAEFGVSAYGRLPLETVLAGRPDLLVLDGNANVEPARATEFVDHNALGALAGRTRLVSVPIRYSICAGPESIEVLKLLAEARR